MGKKVEAQIKKIVFDHLRTLSDQRDAEVDYSHDTTHLHNVAELTQLVGETLGFDKKEKYLSFAAGWLHDLIRSPSEDPSIGDEEKSAHEAKLVLKKLSAQGILVTSSEEKNAVVQAIIRHSYCPSWFNHEKTRDLLPKTLEDKILLALFVADYIEANGARVIARRCHFVGKERLHTSPEKGGDLQKFGFIPGEDEGMVVAIESILRLTFINPEGLYPDYLRSLVHPLYEDQREFVLGLLKGLNFKIIDLIKLLKKRCLADGTTMLEFRHVEAPTNTDQFEKLVEYRGKISDYRINRIADDVVSSALETVKYFTDGTIKNLDQAIEKWRPKGRTATQWRQKMVEYQNGTWLAKQKVKIRSKRKKRRK